MMQMLLRVNSTSVVPRDDLDKEMWGRRVDEWKRARMGGIWYQRGLQWESW